MTGSHVKPHAHDRNATSDEGHRPPGKADGMPGSGGEVGWPVWLLIACGVAVTMTLLVLNAPRPLLALPLS